MNRSTRLTAMLSSAALMVALTGCQYHKDVTVAPQPGPDHHDDHRNPPPPPPPPPDRHDDGRNDSNRNNPPQH